MDAKDRRKQKRQEQVREEILAAARRVLLEKGLAGLTLAGVARELELTKAALYYYFPSKDDLVFELIFLSHAHHAQVVGAAVAEANDGAQALEILIRAAADHFATHLDHMRLAFLVPQIGVQGTTALSPDQLERVRPFNERLFGTVASKIASDQAAGLIPRDIDGRRLAFVAHNAVLGIVTMQGLIEAAQDAPLMHPPQAMVDELVDTFRARLGRPMPR